MSLNGAIFSPDGTPVLVAGEKLFLNQGGVMLEYESGNGYPGQGNNFYSQKGTLFLTNRRVIYVSVPQMDFFQNLNVPLDCLKEGKFQQPWLQSNYYEATVQPIPNGGLTLPGRAKFSFKEGGGFEFSSMFMQLRSRLTGDTLPHEESLPMYTPVANAAPSGSASASNAAPVFPVPLPPAFSERGAEGAHPGTAGGAGGAEGRVGEGEQPPAYP
ncbi:uncharacterized protein EV422DRAFT_543731 [Fimicolochytrium jonesii]|uniref:uncharacterized protein n=1 Tax=Fimicolochytrium jonesii TaxID=1396493 RepID=UPI0022FF25C4|nr:uncharacterized protein EV422DRAFT_543731 [Fimicolochytrium jonesii]KAI8816963.1 hypothetical protein EV422DRAFT_543731 [Fimicolochytrium jonesii]